MKFKEFLLNENKEYLGQKMGDILTALSDLEENGKSMGLRQLNTNAQTIVNQIRRVLHSNWKKEDIKSLAPIQKIGAAIMRAIEEKDDIIQVISASVQELQKVVSDMGTPINNLATPDSEQKMPEAPAMIAPPQTGISPPKQAQNQQPSANPS